MINFFKVLKLSKTKYIEIEFSLALQNSIATCIEIHIASRPDFSQRGSLFVFSCLKMLYFSIQYVNTE